ncbi:MAG: hypothetical protein KKD38_07195 [Candidatus Delongbacteria bacterium]|nr:hypothetical protein [Candidatus Delongbacteria bacterium]MCG2760583.1 D-Ala-D-Ala carboxypeptidase family metallohydrolase [Candidatus Delongbacteria bacterium]
MKKTVLLYIIFALVTVFSADSRCNFRVVVNKEKNDLKIFSIFVMPGNNFDLKVLSREHITVQFNNNLLLPKKGVYSIIAPKNKGNYDLLLVDSQSDSMLINVFVKVPLSKKKGEYLNGYRIGNYPLKPLSNDPVYEKPKGLIEVTEKNKDMKLSPNFALSDFVCKQESDFPKYIIIKERLLLKLEYILELLRNKNIGISKFKFISAYRTPYYNKSIGNVAYSRHIYGGAADICIDEDNNGRMDDINKDGILDHKDAVYFYQLIEEQTNDRSYLDFIGGLGLYKRNEAHPSFIHVDTRGFKARW